MNIDTLPNSDESQTLPLVEGEQEQPIVFFSAEARRTIDHIVSSTSFEAAWFGLVDELSEGEFLIYKIYIPEQEVTAASVDVSSDSVTKLVNQIMDDDEDPGKLRYHGHSHVNMAVRPSLTDQEHILDYMEHAEWYIRGIHNKKGEEKIDIFDKRTMLTHQCVETEIYEVAQTDEWYHKLDAVIANQIKKTSFRPSYYKQNRGAILPAKFEPKTPSYYANQMVAKNRNLTEEEETYEELMKDPFYVGGY